jgi:HlyD family secretion protein
MEMKQKPLKWALVAGVVGAVVVAGWLWMRRGKNGTQYQTAEVARGDLTQTVTATGQLNPVVNVQVGSQISGMIHKLFVDFNSPVKEGQVIAQIDPATYQANLAQTEADLASARAALELAQVKANRARELREEQLIPQSDLDQALADLHQSEAAVKQKEAAVQKVKVDLARCTIYSPVDGIVIDRKVDVGQTVAASLSAPTLFVIANDLAKMQIEANVAEADIGGVEAGQEVEFTVDAFPQRTFRGKVTQIRNAPVTVQNVVTYDTIIEVANPDLKLKPGMTANVSIIVAHRDDALKIPNAALRYRPAGSATNAAPRIRAGERVRGERRGARSVYVLKNSRPQPVQIKTGVSDGIFTEVLEGLNEGDLVITGAAAAREATQQPANPFSSPLRGRRL